MVDIHKLPIMFCYCKISPERNLGYPCLVGDIFFIYITPGPQQVQEERVIEAGGTRVSQTSLLNQYFAVECSGTVSTNDQPF